MMPIRTASYHSRIPFAKSQLLTVFLLWLTAHGGTLDYPLLGVLQTSEFMLFSNICVNFAGPHNLTIWDAPKLGFFLAVMPGALKALVVKHFGFHILRWRMLTCAYVMRHNIEMLSQELAIYCERSFTNANLLPASVSPYHTFALPLFANPDHFWTFMFLIVLLSFFSPGYLNS